MFVGDDLFKNFPHFGNAVFNKATGAANIEREFSLKKSGDDERAEEFERHVLRETAFVEFEIRDRRR